MFIFGALGAISRFSLDHYLGQKWDVAFPVGTFTVNIIGSLLLGFLYGLHLKSTFFHVDIYTVLTTGFCGSFTTFSTYMYESFKLIESGEVLTGTINILITTGLCLAFIFIGIILGRAT